MTDLKFLCPINLSNKLRLGNQHDGGYVVYKPILYETDVLITYGVGYDVSFEESFNELTGKKVLMYDPTILDDQIDHSTKISFLKKGKFVKWYQYTRFKNYWKQKLEYLRKKNIYFINEGISVVEKTKYNTFEKHLKNNHIVQGKVLLKIDIEGNEYDIFAEDCFYENLQIVNQIIIEFHDLKNKLRLLKSIICRLKNDFEIIHIHGCNFAETFTLYTFDSDIIFPDVVEVTLVRKELIRKEDILVESVLYPVDGLDYPCNPKNDDIPLKFN